MTTNTDSKETKKVGRPPENPERLRDYRGNLLLDDREELVFKAILSELTAKEGRRVSGAELLRRLTLPFIEQEATRLGVELHSKQRTDADAELSPDSSEGS